jgi:hypothetical protein
VNLLLGRHLIGVGVVERERHGHGFRGRIGLLSGAAADDADGQDQRKYPRQQQATFAPPEAGREHTSSLHRFSPQGETVAASRLHAATTLPRESELIGRSGI